MDRVLLGFKRHMIPVPWPIFTRLVRKGATKAARAIGPLDDEQRRVHHFVVGDLPRIAEPMPPEHIAEALRMPLEQVVPIVDELERRKLFLFRPGGRDIVWAYPVTAASTPHHMAFSTGERIDAA
jgi:hypothetical protein